MINFLQLLMILFSLDGIACGIVRRDTMRPFGMSYEETVIVWDRSTQTQHFIRKAKFNNKGEQFGFIVPVPAQAEVADFQHDLLPANFKSEMERLRPREKKYESGFFNFFFPEVTENSQLDLLLAPITSAAVRGGVSVAQEFSLASYDVKVIQADGISPLLEWLKENQFQASAVLEEYLNHYVEKNWFFVVFNFRGNDSKTGAATNFVRISFRTDVPFYPYQEPNEPLQADDFDSGRRLKLFLYSDVPLRPDFHNNSPRPEKWSSGPEFAGPIRQMGVIKNLSVGIAEPWLTVWVDETDTRPSRDITFIPGDKKDIRLLPPHIHKIKPDEIVFLWGLPLMLVVFVFCPKKKRLKLQQNLELFCGVLAAFFIGRIIHEHYSRHNSPLAEILRALFLGIFFIGLICLKKGKLRLPAWIATSYLIPSILFTVVLWGSLVIQYR